MFRPQNVLGPSGSHSRLSGAARLRRGAAAAPRGRLARRRSRALVLGRRAGVVAAIQLLAAVLLAPPASAAQTLTVTTTDDGSGPCTATYCTLRAAITAANAAGGDAVIGFNIAPAGPKTITVGAGGANPLPAITGSDVVLDATTQPEGGPTGIRLDDPDTGDRETGLVLQGQRITVRGFAITRFDGFGMWLTSTSRDAVIVGNWIGTADGTTPLGTADDGMRVQGSGHRIGGTVAADRNVISGNGNDGIQLTNSSDDVIVGNYVGMTADGLSRLPNSDTGIQITSASYRNRIGGTTAAERNIASGNNGIGIQLLGTMRTDGTCASPEQNLVEGNYAGLDANGVKPSPYGNKGAGIELGVCARNNTIGGSSTGAGNVASGNSDDGIQLDGRNGPGGTGAVCGNTIQGNISGLDPLGRSIRSNTDDGIDLDRGACNNTVTHNIVAGNSNDGIDLHERNANDARTSGNQITANTVGLAADGMTSLPNRQHGVHIRYASTGNTVDGNTIAANGMSGVAIETSYAAQNVVRNNLIGLAADGSTIRGNRGNGVWLASGTRGNTIATNTIAGNSGAGVAVDPQSSTTPTDTNRITRNAIRDNGGLGIDLIPTSGVNPNDGTTSTAVGNIGLDYPVLRTATQTSVAGTAPPNSLVEVFLARSGTGETNGEGASYLGSATADGSGAWCLGGLSVTGAVTATTTDSRGDTSEFAANLAPSGTDTLCAAPTTIVSDTFSRSVTNGWGSTGQFPWSVTGTASDYWVNGAAGVIQQSAAGARQSTLAIGQQNVSVRTRFRFSNLPSSSWVGFFDLARVTSSGQWYGVRVRSVAGAADDIEINRNTTADGLVKLDIGAVVPDFTAGTWYSLRVDVQGDGTTTTIRGRVWPDGMPEPTTWTVTASDATPALQGQGGVGVRLQSTSAAGPAGVEVDDFTVSSLG